MKVSEFRKLIREEVRKIVNEVEYNPMPPGYKEPAGMKLDPNATYVCVVDISRGGGVKSVKKSAVDDAAAVAKKMGHEFIKIDNVSYIDYNSSSDTATLVGKPSTTNLKLKKFWDTLTKDGGNNNQSAGYIYGLVIQFGK